MNDQQIAALAPLVAFAAAAPATDPGEGYWSDIEVAFGCGERAAQFQAAKRIREALAGLGLPAPIGVPLCPGCSHDAAWGSHDPDCTFEATAEQEA